MARNGYHDRRGEARGYRVDGLTEFDPHLNAARRAIRRARVSPSTLPRTYYQIYDFCRCHHHTIAPTASASIIVRTTSATAVSNQKGKG